MLVEDEDFATQVLSKRSNADSSFGGSSHGDPRKRSKNSTTSPATSPLQTRKSELSAARQNLPVYKFKKQVNDFLRKHDVLLVVAETGSGKSTQIPAYLDESGLFSSTKSKFGRSICVTQPRRVAAVTVAKRVAEERGCTIGKAVGYRVRFDDCTEQTTRIVYATDGMLLRESMSDPLLTRYSVVVLDESHERSLQTDILFGVVSRAMVARGAEVKRSSIPETSGDESMDAKIRRRMKERAQQLDLPKLKVVVMSATLDVQTFQSFFKDAAIIQIPGRLYPVQVVYAKDPQDDYVDSALATAIQIHEEAEEGDVLVFLPGQEEIEDLASLLRRHLEQGNALEQALTSSDIVQAVRGIGTNLDGKVASIVNGVMICVLYAALPPEAQMVAFQPKPVGCSRKIVLATNIAETSVTLDGIRYVVDCGKHKTRGYNGMTGMESLDTRDISKAQAAQRAGRAGRLSSGVCFRLYTEDAFDSLEETSEPEILRVNLSQVVLMLKGMGVHNPTKFEYLTAPNRQSLKKATQLLFALGALNKQMELTEYGKKMAKLPVDPVYAHLLLQSGDYGCTSEMLTVVAMLSAENIMYRPGGGGLGIEGKEGLSGKAAAAHRRFISYEGDLPTLLSIYNAWRKEAIYAPNGGVKALKKLQKSGGSSKLLHGEWCTRNFISGRALVRAHNVRHQLSAICSKGLKDRGLGLDIDQSCRENMESFLKCACAGLFLQSASRIYSSKEIKGRGAGSLESTRGRFKTKVGNVEVSIHPTSAMFGRNPAPKCVVYTELLVTKKTYIRGVTQVREEWLVEVAPQFFSRV
eukprot:scaffold22560_cov135-Cylindrotheca_fusiformis.AAC.13